MGAMEASIGRHVSAGILLIGMATGWGTQAFAGTTQCSMQSSSPARVEQYIRRSEEEWAKSVATNDASVVRRILADDFIWVLDGRLLDKRTAVAEAADGPGPFISNTTDYVHVRFFGKTAVAQGSETWTKTGGRRGKFVWTDTWVNRGGCWQIVNAQDTVVLLPQK
jgi:ketosteroid isomerase-like protein